MIALVVVTTICVLHLGPYALRRAMVLRVQSRKLKAQATDDVVNGGGREPVDGQGDGEGGPLVR